MAKPAIKTCSDHAFHVDHNEAQDRWDVVDQEGKVIGHSHTQGEAIDLAIREAQHTHIPQFRNRKNTGQHVEALFG